MSTYTLQCDQMARLMVQILAIYNDEDVPNSKKLAKLYSKFSQTLNKHQHISKKCKQSD